MRAFRALVVLAALAPVAFAAYVLEWSTPVAYSMANAYTSNRSFSYDVTGDSIPDLFVMDSSALKVFSGVTHSLIWSIPLSYTYGGYPLIGNTDGDPNRELVFSAYSYSYPNYSGRFFIYDCQSHNQEYASPTRSGYPSLALADIDGDNKSEICLVSGAAGSRLLEVYGSNDAATREPPEPDPTGAGLQALPSPATRLVRLELGTRSDLPVAIFSLSGSIVRTLAASSATTVYWDCCDDAGQPVPAGTYLFRAGTRFGRVEVTR